MSNHNFARLFVGSYTSAHKPGIHAYAFNIETGEISQLNSFSGIANPSFLVLHPDGKWLYTVSELGMGPDGKYGEVHALEIHHGETTVDLKPINSQTTDGDWPCHLAIDATGKWLVTSNYGTGNAAMYPIQADGSIGAMQAFVQHEGSGPNAARQERAHAHSATFTPDNLYVIIADLGIDKLVVYRFDADTGTLSHHAEVAAAPGAGPRHLAFHPDGKHVMAANELDSSVTVYLYDTETGSLVPQQTLSTLLKSDPENTVADIHFAPDGGHIYASNRGHNSIAVYRVSKDAHLERLAIPPCGGNWPRNFALSPDGQFMLTANRYSGEISVLPVEMEGAVIRGPIQQTSVEGPSCVIFDDVFSKGD